jgi:hypothetical protein
VRLLNFLLLLTPIVEDALGVVEVPEAILHGDVHPRGPGIPRRGNLQAVALGAEGELSIDLGLLHRGPFHEVVEVSIHCLCFRFTWL